MRNFGIQFSILFIVIEIYGSKILKRRLILFLFFLSFRGLVTIYKLSIFVTSGTSSYFGRGGTVVEKYMAQFLHIGLFLDPLLTYLLVSASHLF